MACIFAVIFGIPLTFANPFMLFLETVREASLYETNFRLSLKQLYDGDRLSTHHSPVKQFKAVEAVTSSSS